MAGMDGRTGGFCATVGLDSVERICRMEENGQARSPAGHMAMRHAHEHAHVLQAGIRADDIRLAAFPIGS